LVTIGTVAEPFATEGGRFCSDEASPPAGGSPGGGGMPGARVNFGGDGASAGPCPRPAASRPAAVAPALSGCPSDGDVEVPEPPDFAVVSVIN